MVKVRSHVRSRTTIVRAVRRTVDDLVNSSRRRFVGLINRPSGYAEGSGARYLNGLLPGGVSHRTDVIENTRRRLCAAGEILADSRSPGGGRRSTFNVLGSARNGDKDA